MNANNNIKRRLQLLKAEINLLQTLKANGVSVESARVVEVYKQLKHCRKLINNSISTYIDNLYKTI